MEIISIIADVCGILGFIISIFVVSKVYNIRKEQKNNNKVDVSGKATISGDFIGRDKNKGSPLCRQ
ncbi:MAG: hypothetical protein LBS55_09920 [Prevotellaceae bacterium]|jgi:hypothetical protein|nr:hypothetical protein [Prevotellaceae bacterium]